MKSVFIIGPFLLLSFSLQAAWIDRPCQFVQRWPLLSRFLPFCRNTENIDKIAMPEIPFVQPGATSSKSYPRKKIKLDLEIQKRYDNAFIRELFIATRRQDVSAEDFSRWMNVLSQGGSREGVYRAIVLDETYGQFEKMEIRPSQKCVEITRKYLQKFLHQDVDAGILRRFSIFSLKREVVERFLEVFDELSFKQNDLHNWYALLSADIATDFPQLFKGIRSSTDPRVHKHWAEKVPFQYIKSEIILKIHTALNTFLP